MKNKFLLNTNLYQCTNRNRSIFSRLLILTSWFLVLYSCSPSGNGSSEPTDTPTSGEVNICVDESYSLLFDTEIYVFESLYTRAKVHAKYLPEADALQMMMKDSCKVVVMNRDLTQEERKEFEVKGNLYPKSTKIAEDAVALVLNNENADTTFTVEEIKNILSGKDSLWKQLRPSSKLEKINVVFDNKGSANARYMEDTLLKGQPFAKNVFAVNSNAEVIEYVNKNKNAIGVVSVNWISDRDDTLSRRFLTKIKVAGISRDTADKPRKPYQAYIKTKEYPFCRDVYMINRQTRAGLGMGFVSFVAGEKGQLIILKSALIPAIAPVRIININ